MLKRIRKVLALFFFIFITLLFLDFTGTIHKWFGWMAKVQFLPSVLALNVVVILLILLITLIFGRIYCSVICPLGVMQDIFGWLGKKSKKNRYSYSKAKTILRYSVLCLFILAVILGIGSFVALLAPYSSYGRIAQNILSPIYLCGNNILAYFSERAESYAFYSKDIWIRSIPVLAIASVTLVCLFVLAWRNGRTYCNTICPVGTVLGFFARFSLFKPRIDTSKCVNCTLCAKNCKAACIDIKNHKIDYSRCVVCGDCMAVCHKSAISYLHFVNNRAESPDKQSVENSANKRAEKRAESIAEKNAERNAEKNAENSAEMSVENSAKRSVEKSAENNTERRVETKGVDDSRRKMLAITATLATASVLKAQDKITDGGLQAIISKQAPSRDTQIVPPGAKSIRNLSTHCTGCQLCVSVCPNGVLRPSENILTLMQPRSSYERGYCRPECTKCSEVCPAGAIVKLTKEQKSSTQIGHAVWDSSLCLPMVDGTHCGNCARHCPSGAIELIEVDPTDPNSAKFPVVNEERCIGCGACEYVCPARPLSAIYVEGHEVHREI